MLKQGFKSTSGLAQTSNNRISLKSSGGAKLLICKENILDQQYKYC